MVLAFVGMSLSTAIVLDDKIHLPDSLVPHDTIILPELLHWDVFFEDAGCFVDRCSDASVPFFNSLVRDVANAPSGWCVSLWLIKYLYPKVNASIAIVDRSRPIARAIRIEKMFSHIEVRFAWLGIVCVALGVGELNIKQDELLGSSRARQGGEGEQKAIGKDCSQHLDRSKGFERGKR